MNWLLWLQLVLDLILLTVVSRYFRVLQQRNVSPVRLWIFWGIWLVALTTVGYTIWQLWQS